MTVRVETVERSSDNHRRARWRSRCASDAGWQTQQNPYGAVVIMAINILLVKASSERICQKARKTNGSLTAR